MKPGPWRAFQAVCVLLISVTLGAASTGYQASAAAGLAAPPSATATDAGLTVVAAVRVLDTRSGVGVVRGSVPAGGRLTVQVGGRGGVPVAASAVALNFTVTNPTRGGYLQVGASGAAVATSSVNFVAGQTIANLVLTRLSDTGRVDIVNRSAGTVDIIADTNGAGQSPDAWFGQGEAGHNQVNPGPVGLTTATVAGLTKSAELGREPQTIIDGMIINAAPGWVTGSDAATGTRLWTVPLTDRPSSFYPLVAVSGHTVFVDFEEIVSTSTGQPPTQVWAINDADGRVVWGNHTERSAGMWDTTAETPGPMVVHHNRLFLGTSVITAFDAGSGTVVWRNDDRTGRPGVFDIAAYEGKLYLSGSNVVQVWDAQTGKYLWNYPVGPYDANHHRIVVAQGRVLVNNDPYLVSFDAGGCGPQVCPAQWSVKINFPGQPANETHTPSLYVGAVDDDRVWLIATASAPAGSLPSGASYLASLSLNSGAVITATKISAQYDIFQPPFIAGGVVWVSSHDNNSVYGYSQACSTVCQPLVTLKGVEFIGVGSGVVLTRGDYGNTFVYSLPKTD